MNCAPANERLGPTLAALSLCVALGVAGLHAATFGFRVVSTESGRRLSVAARPVALPAVALSLPSGAGMPLPTSFATDARPAIVVFFYSRCESVCSVLGDEMQRLQAQIFARGLERRVRLVGISFDPADDAAALAAYAARMGADPRLWRVAGVSDARARARLLEACGVTVVAAPFGQFVHNAAFHLVDRNARLVRILDYDDPDGALAAALALEAR